MEGAEKSVKRGLDTRRRITAASFADSCHSDERKQVTQEVESKNTPRNQSLVFSLVSLRPDHPPYQGKGQLLPPVGLGENTASTFPVGLWCVCICTQ